MTTLRDSEVSETVPAATDSELIAAVAGGDSRALETLYDRYSRIVYSFALRILGDPLIAEEVTQEVFLRVWQQGAGFSSLRGAFVTWLLSITHNMSIDEVRKRNRRPQRTDSDDPELLLGSLPDTGMNVEDEVWLSSLRDIVGEALGRLPKDQREAIELAYFRGLTQREIAETLGQPLGTIKTRMRLGLQKLRDYLGDSELELLTRNGADEA